MVIDLSHRIEPGMPVYPGMPEPKFRVVMEHGGDSKGRYAPGTSFQIAAYEFGGNTGTYVDAPFHRHAKGADLADVPLESLADLPGELITGAADGRIDASYFEDHALAGKAVLVHTEWSRLWGSEGYFRSGPYLTAEACEYLVSQKAKLVGIDCANIDNMQDAARPAHTLLLAAGIPIVEHLCGLGNLRGKSWRFFAAPPAVRGGTSYPVRALAVVKD